MINKENQTGRTGGKTKTSNLNQWADNTFNPAMGCKVKRLDRQKTQVQARVGGMKWYDSHVPSYADAFCYTREVNS